MDYYPFGLTHNQNEGRELNNKYLFNGGAEWQNEFDLNLHMTPNRMLDPALGRFWGIDALSDLMPGISPMVYGYNNPIFFNDPLGLAGVPGCDECEGTVLDEVVVTASRLPQTDYSFLFNSSNPVHRNLGLRAKNNDREYIQHAFNQSPIQYGEGLGYTTQFQQGINTIAGGVSSSLVYASFGAMAAPIIAYGSPYLFKGLSIADRVTGGAVLRMGVEGASQGIVNVATEGFTMNAINAMDLADIGFASINRGFVLTSALGASVNFEVSTLSFSGIGVEGYTDKNARAFARDFVVGLGVGGHNKALQKMEISSFWKKVMNGTATVKAKGLGAASDQIKKE